MASMRTPYIPVEDPFMTGMSQGQQMMGQYVDPLMNAMLQASQIKRQNEIDAENRQRYDDELAMRQAEIERSKTYRTEDIARSQAARGETLTSNYMTARNQFGLSYATETIYDKDTGLPIGKTINPEKYKSGLSLFDQYSRQMPGYVPIPAPPGEYDNMQYGGELSPEQYYGSQESMFEPRRQFNIMMPEQTRAPQIRQTENVPADIWEQTPAQAAKTAGSYLYEKTLDPYVQFGRQAISDVGRAATQPIGQTASEITYPVRHPLEWITGGPGTYITPEQEAMLNAPNPDWMPEPMTKEITRVQPRRQKRPAYSPYMQR